MKMAWPRKVPKVRRYALLTPFRMLYICTYNPFQRASQRNRSNAPCGSVFVPFSPPYQLINDSLPYLESPAVQLHCAIRINLVQSIRHQIHFASRVFVESLSNFILANPLLALITSSSWSLLISCSTTLVCNFVPPISTRLSTHPDDARRSLHLLDLFSDIFSGAGL